jgi:hypothetical protein
MVNLMYQTLGWETSLRVGSVGVVAELPVGVAIKKKSIIINACIYSNDRHITNSFYHDIQRFVWRHLEIRGSNFINVFPSDPQEKLTILSPQSVHSRGPYGMYKNERRVYSFSPSNLPYILDGLAWSWSQTSCALAQRHSSFSNSGTLTSAS